MKSKFCKILIVILVISSLTNITVANDNDLNRLYWEIKQQIRRIQKERIQEVLIKRLQENEKKKKRWKHLPDKIILNRG